MSAFENKYFALDGGLSFKSFLKHFKDQAAGNQSVVLVGSNASDLRARRFRNHMANRSLILVDLADSSDNTVGDKMPRVEVVDPNESERRRALDQVAVEERDRKVAQGGGTKKTPGSKGRHSTAGGDKKQTAKRRRQTDKSAAEVVKRVRDLFDEQ